MGSFATKKGAVGNTAPKRTAVEPILGLLEFEPEKGGISGRDVGGGNGAGPFCTGGIFDEVSGRFPWSAQSRSDFCTVSICRQSPGEPSSYAIRYPVAV